MLLHISDHNVKPLQAASPMHSASPAKAVDVRWQILASDIRLRPVGERG